MSLRIRATITPRFMPGVPLTPAMPLNSTPAPCNSGWLICTWKLAVQSAGKARVLFSIVVADRALHGILRPVAEYLVIVV